MIKGILLIYKKEVFCYFRFYVEIGIYYVKENKIVKEKYYMFLFVWGIWIIEFRK